MINGFILCFRFNTIKITKNDFIDCKEGSYGNNCSQKCKGHCKDNTTCNHVTGHCERGCKAGWTGSSCDKGDII